MRNEEVPDDRLEGLRMRRDIHGVDRGHDDARIGDLRGVSAVLADDPIDPGGDFLRQLQLEAQAQAESFGPHPPLKVIVAEEVKTAHQGEVIGLFLKEKIPRGLSLQETVAEIKAQGGVVYVPHPFDRMHSVPDYEHLLAILEDVDAIEIFNPRVAIQAFNDEAVRFAA